VARCAFTAGVILGGAVRFAIDESGVALLLPSFEVVEDGDLVASEELCDAGCAPVLCGESDGEGASSDFGVCVWVVEQLLERRVFVWCQLDAYRCSHVEIIPQRHLLGMKKKYPNQGEGRES
jgi:hypothetical protein